MRFNKIEFFFFAIIRIKWKLDQYMIIIIQRFLFIVLYESKLLYNIYIKNIYFHIHMQLLFYNAKLMYCSIIVMDFSDFPIFDKKISRYNEANIRIQYYYLIITINLIQIFCNQTFLQFFYKISVVNFVNNIWTCILKIYLNRKYKNIIIRIIMK